MISPRQLSSDSLRRRIRLEWRYGVLRKRTVAISLFFATIASAAAVLQAVRGEKAADRLSVRLAHLRSVGVVSAAEIPAAAQPDVVQTLPPAPTVAQVIQTLQLTAGKEGAKVMSLQAEDHSAAATALGHLDLALSVRAPFPSILVVIQQVLDRYPSATLRQMLVAPVTSASPTVAVMSVPAAKSTSASQSDAESEVRLTLAFWRRPLGVQSITPISADTAATVVAATSASAAVAIAHSASIGMPVGSMDSTSTPSATVLPPMANVSSAAGK